MKKLFLLAIVFLFLFPKTCLATASEYTIESFDSQMEVNQNTSLTITETIIANFLVDKHGIFRVIPVTYSANGKTIRANLKILSITDDSNKPYQYTEEGYNQSIRLKIGDPDRTITGLHTYIIKYNIDRVLLRYQEHDEVYWNITGSEWDTTINQATATVRSSFAAITNAICYAGQIKTQEKACTADFDGQTAGFNTTAPLSWGKDFTIVVALSKENQLVFPGLTKRTANAVADNWGYPAALIPLAILFFAWYKKGRDIRYLSDNVYTVPDNQKTRTVSLFEREHLPLVYSPIQGLTPSQIGTIIDEKVDTKDIVAEIVELARLGFIEIQKTEKKGLLRKQIDYVFINKNKDASSLKDYQKLLLDSLFERPIDISDLSEIFKEMVQSDKGVVKEALSGKLESTSLSKLKNHFYEHLDSIKRDLYENLSQEKIFDGNPEKTKSFWVIIYILLTFFDFFAVIIFSVVTGNGGPLPILFLSIIPAIFLIKNMPRRTAWGHSLFRQITGLKFYISEGKWREEIAEKNLFFEEILPLAICLGVVNKLALDMSVLGIEPPEYLNGFTTAYLVSDLNHFSSSTANTLVSTPAPSGHSSWSGGSGFGGGGSSGGGFGGGGGGSW